MIPQNREPFARPGFDQCCYQQPIHRPTRLLLVNQQAQLGAIVTRPNLPKTHPASLQNVEHHVKVRQLFLHDFGHFSAQFDVINVREQKVHGCASRLFLAVRMVNQQFFDIVGNLVEPSSRGRRL